MDTFITIIFILLIITNIIQLIINRILRKQIHKLQDFIADLLESYIFYENEHK